MEGRSGTPVVGDGALLAGQLALMLAVAGDAMLTEALRLMVRTLGLRSAVLRGAEPYGAGLLAMAGAVVHAAHPLTSVGRVPVSPACAAPLVVAVQASGRDLARLTVEGHRPAQLPVLRACAAVIALVLAAGSAEADAVLGLGLLQAEAADRDEAADALHDGPLQSLVVARYAADATARGADPSVAREAVQSALVGLRRTMWQLRPRGADDLAAALRQLDAQLTEGDRPALDLQVDPASAGRLTGLAALTAYGLVQAAALVDRTQPLTVELLATRRSTVLTIDGTVPAVARWELRLRALGAATTVEAGGVLVRFPQPDAAAGTRTPAPADPQAAR